MTPIYPMNDREDLGNMMTSSSSRQLATVEIGTVRLCRPSVCDRSVQVCIHMQISVYDHALRMNMQVSYMYDFLYMYIYIQTSVAIVSGSAGRAAVVDSNRPRC